nr:MAG TPA: hypothetical protein [Bacteriophage sp.]
MCIITYFYRLYCLSYILLTVFLIFKSVNQSYHKF